MPSNNTNGINSFLSQDPDLDSAAPTVASQRDDPSSFLTFAELSPSVASETIVVIPAKEAGGVLDLDTETRSTLRAEIQNWIQCMKNSGQLLTELMSPSIRDQFVTKTVQHLLENAASAPSRTWMLGLPTGRQIVVIPESLYESVGFMQVCREAHEKAIRMAQSLGLAYNAEALVQYSADQLTPSL